MPTSPPGPDSTTAGEAVIEPDEMQQYWHDAAPWYDGDLAGRGREAPARSAAELRAWELIFRRTFGRPPCRILDVGTGTGNVALLLASFGYDVTAVDAAERMVEITAEKAERVGLALTTAVAQAADVPYAPDCFDAVIARLVLWTQPEPERAVAEWVRVTRLRGRVAIMETRHGRKPNPIAGLRQQLGYARLWDGGVRTLRHDEDLDDAPHVGRYLLYRDWRRNRPRHPRRAADIERLESLDLLTIPAHPQLE